METEEAARSRKAKNEKISRVLQKFLEPNFKIRNDVYLNLFLTHLVGKSGENKSQTKEREELFVQWLIQASNLWGKTKINPPSVILPFVLNLSSQLSVDEQVFVKLNSQNVYESLVGLAQINLNNDANVTLGLVTLLCSFLEHKSGVQWVLATTHWTGVITLGREAHTMYIRKKSFQFVAKLLQKTKGFNQNFCNNLVCQLIKPLLDTLKSIRLVSVQPALIENRALFDGLRPNLIFLSEVLEILLKSEQSHILNLFIEFKAAELIQKLLLLSQSEEFSFELIKIRCILLFSKLVKQGPVTPGTVRTIAQDSVTLFDMKTLFDVIQNEMDKDHVKCVIKICHYAHTLYCNLSGKLPLCIRKGEPIEFQNQMVLFQIMPIMIFLSEKRRDVILNDVFKREFIQKLVKMSAIRTLEICFRWKERLMQKPDLIEDMTLGLQYMVKTKNLLNKERAAIFFQPLVYSLKDALTILEGEGYIEMDQSYATFLRTLIETIIDLVQSFDLTWRDSIETISVMSIACEFLQYTQWDQKLVVSGLKLLNLAISKYMSPDMVLLMDNCKDSMVMQTGSLLYAKCHDNSWEVRDTALENVYTISLNAKSKFPSYTNILVEAQLPQLVLQMALRDGEYYVRATAFKCLIELIQIEEVWKIFMGVDNFLETILATFETETEGVVRKDVATLINKINEFQSFPEEILPRIYDLMTHAVVGDLHWEVKCNALDFWYNICKKYLSNQGMIDCMFPAVTFSKEQRKIVNLNEAEVRKRLVKVLNQLSHIGCLYVMKSACLDDCDVEVSKKAAEMAAKLAKFMQKYKLSYENIDITDPSPTSSPASRDDSAPSPANSATCSAATSDCFLEFSTSMYDSLSPFPLPAVSPPPLDLDIIASPSAAAPIYSSKESASSPVEHQSASTSSTQSVSTNPNVPVSDQETAQFDPLKADSILDDLLNSNDMAFLQRIYNPSEQVKNATGPMKKRTYLAPSEFLKFIYNEAEKNATGRTEWLDSLDEFDSLLDDILKEYNVVPDVNGMDCY